MIVWRTANKADVPAVVALLADDLLGAKREIGEMAIYDAAFDAMQREPHNHLIVGELDGRVVATYQLTFVSGMSLLASRRAVVESVRVVSDMRSRGIGEALMADAEARARAAGCQILQLTTNKARARAHAFYDRVGFTASHIGYKRQLN
jgi:GNAT superfamily N-acetyltransferase